MASSTTTVRVDASTRKADVALCYIATRDAAGAVLCTASAPPAGAANLRCRFPGGAEVPAAGCDGGICCTPPETAAGAIPYSVLYDDAQLLAEGLLDTGAPPAAPAEAPAKPAGRMSGLKPFAIMCALLRCPRCVRCAHR